MNRIIPDFSKDKRVNELSLLAEVIFRRLWNKADDFGRYYADPMILKAELFPRREIRTPDLCRALQECERAALLVQYTTDDGEQYLQINEFNQRVRAAKSKFPPPPNVSPTDVGKMSDSCRTNDGQMSDSCPPESETESETEINTPNNAGAGARGGAFNPQGEAPRDGYTLAEVLDVAKDPSVCVSEDEANAFFDYYDAQGWEFNNGRSVASLHSALRRWKRGKRDGPAGGAGAASPNPQGRPNRNAGTYNDPNRQINEDDLF